METTTDRALAAAAAAAAAIIEEELGKDVAVACLFTMAADNGSAGERPNGSGLILAANMDGRNLAGTFAGLVVTAVETAKAAGADVDAVSQQHPFPPPSMN